jgi:hypothetical protein
MRPTSTLLALLFAAIAVIQALIFTILVVTKIASGDFFLYVLMALYGLGAYGCIVASAATATRGRVARTQSPSGASQSS